MFLVRRLNKSCLAYKYKETFDRILSRINMWERWSSGTSHLFHIGRAQYHGLVTFCICAERSRADMVLFKRLPGDTRSQLVSSVGPTISADGMNHC
jgi:hypothetical protein